MVFDSIRFVFPTYIGRTLDYDHNILQGLYVFLIISVGLILTLSEPACLLYASRLLSFAIGISTDASEVLCTYTS